MPISPSAATGSSRSGTTSARGRRELDAEGLLVTPGFVDPHTHYDGQATWDPLLAPSSQHGVTTVAMGNCGVGFAPVEPDRHDWLIATMEGVEDIPGTALHEGLQWDWGSFPEYLDALERQPRTIDVGTHVPHAALRAFVMGERGADLNEHPGTAELETMATLLRQGLEAGALGVTTSRTDRHRTSAGENLGTLRAREPELTGPGRDAPIQRHRCLPVHQRQLPDHRRRVRRRRVRPGGRVRPGQPAAGQLTPCSRTSTPRNGGAT